MTIVRIEADGVSREVDLAPVEEYQEKLEADIRAKRFFRDPHRVDALKKMSHEQLVHIAAILTSMVEEYAQLYNYSFSKQHAKLVKGMREMREAAKGAGEDLWPELDE